MQKYVDFKVGNNTLWHKEERFWTYCSDMQIDLVFVVWIHSKVPYVAE